MIIVYHGGALLLGFLLDLLLGDFCWKYSPIYIIENMVGWLRDHLPLIFARGWGGSRIAGRYLVVLIGIYSIGLPGVILYYLYKIHPLLGCLLEVFLCYQLLTIKALSYKPTMKSTEDMVIKKICDYVIGPMFYMLFGGVPLMYFYKGIQTIDSLIEQNTEKYYNLGHCGGRVYKILSYIPLKITTLVMRIT